MVSPKDEKGQSSKPLSLLLKLILMWKDVILISLARDKR
jgi:hypothetical protein